jgi:hypothetical protein
MIIVSVLINFLLLVLIWNELSNAMEETLSINRFLYCEIAKIAPVLTPFALLVVDLIRGGVWNLSDLWIFLIL